MIPLPPYSWCCVLYGVRRLDAAFFPSASQLHEGYGLPAPLFRFTSMIRNEWMRAKELREATTQSSCPVPMNDPHTRQMGHRGIIQKFIHLLCSLLHRLSNHINIVRHAKPRWRTHGPTRNPGTRTLHFAAGRGLHA